MFSLFSYLSVLSLVLSIPSGVYGIYEIHKAIKYKYPQAWKPGAVFSLVTVGLILGAFLLYFISPQSGNVGLNVPATPTSNNSPQGTSVITSHVSPTAKIGVTPTIEITPVPSPTENPTSTPVTTFTPTPTLTPEQILYNQSTSGIPVLNSSLIVQDANNWSENNNCVFTQNSYHSYDTIQHARECFAQTTNYSNFCFQVNMKIVQGDEGGLIFGYGSAVEYRYGITQYGSTPLGHYDLWVVQWGHALVQNPSAIIKQGLGQNNLITVIVKGTNIYLYINKQFVAHTNTYQGIAVSGEIGLFSDDKSNATEVVFSNAEVWQL